MGTPGHQEAALNALKHSAGVMRTRLTKVLSIRQAPFLKFHLDEGLKKELALLEAIRKANEEDRQRTGGGGDDAVDAAGAGASDDVSTDQDGPRTTDNS